VHGTQTPDEYNIERATQELAVNRGGVRTPIGASNLLISLELVAPTWMLIYTFPGSEARQWLGNSDLPGRRFTQPRTPRVPYGVRTL
jgi:hypothetical protein